MQSVKLTRFTKTGKMFPVAYKNKAQKILPFTPACK